MAGHEPQSQSLKGRQHHSGPMDQSSPPSPIEELQSHFGQLLLSKKDSPPTRTGNFSFLALPRELRDRVYFHYLYRPKGVMYKRCKDSAGSFPFEDSEFVCLFLTSKQVYEEALGIFCRYNSVEIIWNGTYKIYSLPGTLRLFPDKSARMLQRVCRSYSEWSSLCSPGDACEGRGLGRHWIDMAAEAHLFKEYFPSLREFTVRWFVGPRVFKEMDHLDFEDKTSEEKLEIWLQWMKDWAKKYKVVPVPWMNFEFHSHYQVNKMRDHQKELNDAHDILVREIGILPDEEQSERWEQGRKWLEEVWGEGLAANRKQENKITGNKKGKMRASSRD